MVYDILLVDGPYLAHKAFLAPFKLTTSTGMDATMIQAFIRSLNATRKKVKPKQIIIAWESHGTPSWRRELYPAYKPSQPIDIQYVTELKDLQILLYLLNVTQYSAANNEADDVLATLVYNERYQDRESREDNLIVAKTLSLKNILIYTVDKDIMQLVDEHCQIYHDKAKKIFDINEVFLKFNIHPKLIPDLLAIMGDKADNIQGLNGYGNKKAVKLLEKYGNIESIKELDKESMDMITKNKKLTLLNKQCKLRKALYKGEATIESIMDKYELKKMKESIEEYKLLGDAIG